MFSSYLLPAYFDPAIVPRNLSLSEVGASIMVGGNIKGQTRVLTTATVMETGKGNFDVAIALSLILLVLAFTVNYLLTVIQ
jgi:tungstate transport system permease protein